MGCFGCATRMALGLPADGRLLSLERDERCARWRSVTLTRRALARVSNYA